MCVGDLRAICPRLPNSHQCIVESLKPAEPGEPRLTRMYWCKVNQAAAVSDISTTLVWRVWNSSGRRGARLTTHHETCSLPSRRKRKPPTRKKRKVGIRFRPYLELISEQTYAQTLPRHDATDAPIYSARYALDYRDKTPSLTLPPHSPVVSGHVRGIGHGQW